jgi:hypothetical protein
LQNVVSAEYLEERGLREGGHGEVLNERGRVVFDVGFARAIRRYWRVKAAGMSFFKIS